MNITTLPTKVDPKIIIALRKAFGEFYDQNATSFTDQGANLSFQNVTEFVDYLYSPEIGIPKGTSAKWIGITLENWYETVTKAPEFTEPTMTNTEALRADELKNLEERAAAREEVITETKVEAERKVQEFLDQQKKRAERLHEVLKDKKVYARVIEGKEVTNLTPEETKAVEDLQQAVNENPKEVFKELFDEIRARAPQDIPDEAIQQAAYDAVESLRNNPNSSSITQTAFLSGFVSSPVIIQSVTKTDAKTTKETTDTVAELSNSRMSQLELSKKLFAHAYGIKASKAIFKKQIVEFSEVKTERFTQEVNLSQIAQNYSTEVTNQQNFFDSIKGLGYDQLDSRLKAHLGGVIERKIATLPEGHVLRSNLVKTSLSTFGIGAPIEWVVVEGASPMIRFAVSSGYGPLLGTIQEVTGWKLGISKLTTEATKKIGGQVVAQTAGKAVAVTGIKAAISKVTTALSTLIPVPVLNWVIGLVGGEILGKLFGKLIETWGPKINRFFNSIKELLIAAPVAAVFGIGAGLGTFAGLKFLSMSPAQRAGAIGSIRVLVGTIGSTALAGIGGPILFILLGFPVIVALILFIINSGAYLVPPSPLTSENIISPYIGIEKFANPSGPLQNSSLPLSITYTITITAKKESLSNIKIDDDCQVINESGQDTCPSNLPSVPVSISVGSPFVYTYNVEYSGQKFIDSIVINTVNITADTQNSGQQSTSGSASITIGKPPTDCLQIEGNWPSQYKTNLQSAIGTLVSGYSSYVSKVCSSFDKISLLYEPGANGQYWGWNDLQTSGTATIHFYKLGVGNVPDALYTLAHELGHSLASGYQTASIFATYLAYPGIKSEAPYCFYKDTINWNAGESMPEAIALRIIEPKCGSVQQKWPIHFKFLNQYVFN